MRGGFVLTCLVMMAIALCACPDDEPAKVCNGQCTPTGFQAEGYECRATSPADLDSLGRDSRCAQPGGHGPELACCEVVRCAGEAGVCQKKDMCKSPIATAAGECSDNDVSHYTCCAK